MSPLVCLHLQDRHTCAIPAGWRALPEAVVGDTHLDESETVSLVLVLVLVLILSDWYPGRVVSRCVQVENCSWFLVRSEQAGVKMCSLCLAREGRSPLSCS